VDGLVGQDVPLGIIPVGTGNGLARAMSIPLDPQKAMHLLTGAHTIFPIDALQADDHYYVLNVSAGISSRAMRETSPEEKQRIGMLAYAQTILKDVSQAKSSVFVLDLDGLTVRVQAAEVLVANGTVLQEGPMLFGPREHYQDSKLEVNLLTATETSDYVRLARELLLGPPDDITDLHDFTVKDHIRIDVEGSPIPVQADGELIGHTPVEVRPAPRALKILVPEKEG
jgi:diacylglycerol kinase family enzyme